LDFDIVGRMRFGESNLNSRLLWTRMLKHDVQDVPVVSYPSFQAWMNLRRASTNSGLLNWITLPSASVSAAP